MPTVIYYKKADGVIVKRVFKGPEAGKQAMGYWLSHKSRKQVYEEIHRMEATIPGDWLDKNAFSKVERIGFRSLRLYVAARMSIVAGIILGGNEVGEGYTHSEVSSLTEKLHYLRLKLLESESLARPYGDQQRLLKEYEERESLLKFIAADGQID